MKAVGMIDSSRILLVYPIRKRYRFLWGFLGSPSICDCYRVLLETSSSFQKISELFPIPMICELGV